MHTPNPADFRTSHCFSLFWERRSLCMNSFSGKEDIFTPNVLGAMATRKGISVNPLSIKKHILYESSYGDHWICISSSVSLSCLAKFLSLHLFYCIIYIFSLLYYKRSNEDKWHTEKCHMSFRISLKIVLIH